MAKGNPDFDKMIAVLQKHQVDFLTVGGYSIQLTLSNYLTKDVDILANPVLSNMERLANALNELEAKIPIGRGEAVDVHFDARLLQTKKLWNLSCRFGRLDVMTEISSTKSTFRDWVKRAIILRSGNVRIRSASMDDIYESKLRAGRDKDQQFFEEHGDEILES